MNKVVRVSVLSISSVTEKVPSVTRWIVGLRYTKRTALRAVFLHINRVRSTADVVVEDDSGSGWVEDIKFALQDKEYKIEYTITSYYAQRLMRSTSASKGSDW